MERNELCWCGSGKKYKKCHMQIDDKILLLASEGHIVPDRSMLNPHNAMTPSDYSLNRQKKIVQPATPSF